MKALIFDFDGTIADSFETLLGIFQEITKRESLSATEVADLRGQSLKQIIKHLKIKKWQIPRLVLRAKRLLSARMDQIHAFPGVKQALAELSKDNKIYILSTNSPDNIEAFLRKNHLDCYITKMYGDIGLRGKTAGLKKLIKSEKLSKSECLYIGDEERDITAARKAKVTSVGVTWGFNDAEAIKRARPDILVEKTRKLIRLNK